MALLALAFLAFAMPRLHAGKKDEDPSRLTLDRLFGAAELQGQPVGAVRWLSRQTAYTVKAPSEQVKGASDIVRVDPATGERVVVVSARSLIPPGASSPLAVEDYSWSSTESQLLIYTNSKRVWRKNTRGDYWVFDVGSRELRKLGGQAPAASLMFAHFSPDGRKVAYVRDRNIYVEDVATHQITQLTQTESPNIINGTFDWVYEEEFGLHDGFRWSPDSNWIAFWRVDTTGMDDYLLVNNTAGLYQQLTRFKCPKVGRPNAAVRVGLVSAERRRPANEAFAGLAPGHDGGWLDVSGDPREHYIARMDWAADSTTVILQQLNRLQNTNTVFLAQPGRVNPVLVERDKAWVDVHDPLDWLDDGKKFTWFSERDGWRRLYAVSRTGKEIKPITPSGVDIIGVAGIDHQHGWLYYYASADNATQKYLYRVGLDGSGAQRVTPAAQKGTHTYRLSPDGAWAYRQSVGSARRSAVISPISSQRSLQLSSCLRLAMPTSAKSSSPASHGLAQPRGRPCRRCNRF